MKFGLFSKLTLASLILVFLAMILPITKVDNVDAILASATFLYGIFYGFEAPVVLQNFHHLNLLSLPSQLSKKSNE